MISLFMEVIASVHIIINVRVSQSELNFSHHSTQSPIVDSLLTLHSPSPYNILWHFPHLIFNYFIHLFNIHSFIQHIYLVSTIFQVLLYIQDIQG